MLNHLSLTSTTRSHLSWRLHGWGLGDTSIIGVSLLAHVLEAHPLRLGIQTTIKAINSCGHWEWGPRAWHAAQGAWPGQSAYKQGDKPKSCVVFLDTRERLVGFDDISHWDLDAAAPDWHHSLRKFVLTIAMVVLSVLHVAMLVVEWQGNDVSSLARTVFASPAARPHACEAENAGTHQARVATSDVTSDGKVFIGVINREFSRATS